jgi:2-oxoglutarate dehydrogenase E1 component
VVEGSVRARQERRGDAGGERVLPILIHGDAAFAGQGVVMETLQLSQARGFSTDGTVHIIVNNQVGFTTSEPRDARSTLYCSDVAKMIETPVFHVNADDPEAVVFVTRLALDYRMRFRKDVVIDLVCYRRHGHNEADEPSATQPVMYQVIRKHATARQLYSERLVAAGSIDPAEASGMPERYRQGLEEGKPQARAFVGTTGNKFTVDWSRHLEASWNELITTAVPGEALSALGRRMVQVPGEFTLHPRVARVIEDRRRMYAGDLPLDWGAAETLAYATLLKDGFRIRITGQDSGRGTFFHRHAVLHDQATGRRHIPLAELLDEPQRFRVTDSVLSEEAVLGFEYGYSTTSPDTFVIWEAQFGDFVNGAQVIIDQFIASGEAKWGRLSGITLLLPHGYEGQGPEHSSARLERFLQLSAEYNIQVCVPSTPAQMFHMLRRQMRRALRKPLIVMTPKSLLRHKLSVSGLDELVTGRFHQLIDEVDAIEPARVRGWSSAAARSTSTCWSAGGPRASRTWPSSASSSSIRSRRTSTAPSWSATRMRARSSGARRSRRTRAPGTRSGTGCRSSSARCTRSITPGVPAPRRRRRASSRCTPSSSRASWTPRCAPRPPRPPIVTPNA